MPEIIINNIPVNFPFEPYDVQKDYMSKVLECLQKGVNGVLESPTGTGKTLSLLCSSLAWLEIKKAQIQATFQIAGNEGDKGAELFQGLAKTAGVTKSETQTWSTLMGMPQIIYASRTHSQLGQVVAELKRTKYAHFKVSVLGSRDQLCLHPEVSRENNCGIKNSMCRVKVSSRTCHFYNNVDLKVSDPGFSVVMDIEDLVTKSQRVQCCPYYVSKKLQKDADVLFVPYNYLLDARIRKLMDIRLANNVVILDEAHNVEKMCEESASFVLTSTDIALCISEVTQVMKEMHEQMTSASFDDGGTARDFTADDLCILKTVFTELEEAVDKIDLNSGIKMSGSDPGSSGAAFPGSFILDLLAKAEVTSDKLHLLSEVVHNVAEYLVTTSGSTYSHKGVGLQKFSNFIKVVNSTFGQDQRKERIDMFYKVYIEIEVNKRGRSEGWTTKISTKGSAKIIHLWCFSAGQGMRSLIEQGVRSVVLTSGTLAPLDATISELGIPIDVRLENPHIVTGDQVCVSVVGRGPTNTELKSTYENRDKVGYLRELGLTLQNFSRIVPDGLLVFFPSYPTMQKAVSFWQEDGLWTRICSNKAIFVEPQRKDILNEVISKYYDKIGEVGSKGAILLAVCRGKVSEGLDFADCKGRAVVVTGLPYPPLKDPRVVLKRQYLDQNRNDKQNLSGNDWYHLEASRAVNQAIGRVIRHSKDFGAILLCDSRFSSNQMTKSLSKWLQPQIKNCTHFRFAYSSIASFFRNAGILMPPKNSATPGASFQYDEVKIHKKPVAEAKEPTGANLISQFKKRQELTQAAVNDLVEFVLESEPQDLLGALDKAEEKNTLSPQENKVNKFEQNIGFLPEELTGFLKDDQCISPGQSNSSLIGKRLIQNQYQLPQSSSTAKNYIGNSSFESSQSSSSLYGSATKKRKVVIVNKNKNDYHSTCSSNDAPESSSRSALKMDITKMKVVAYWCELKKGLNQENFNKLKIAVANYKNSNNFEELMNSLIGVFPLYTHKMITLFKAFSLCLTPSHKLKFEEFCRVNLK